MKNENYVIELPAVAMFEKIPFKEFKNEFYFEPGVFEEDNLRRIYDEIKLPERKTAGSAGYDFAAPFDFELKPGDTIIIPTGIRAKINPGWMLQLVPRSGLGFKTGMRLCNTVGIIDSDYYYADNYGHIKAKLFNNSEFNKTVSVKAGDGFIQGIFVPFGITYNDNVSTVRTGGFGSTDTK